MSEKDPSGGRRTPRRPFDATWLPFGFMIGTAVGIGTGMVIFGSLLAGVVVGVLLGLAIGVAMGLSRGRGHRSPEEVEDALIDAAEREAEAQRRRD